MVSPSKRLYTPYYRHVNIPLVQSPASNLYIPLIMGAQEMLIYPYLVSKKKKKKKFINKNHYISVVSVLYSNLLLESLIYLCGNAILINLRIK